MENQQLLEMDTQHGRYLTFALGQESFGLEITYVKEIVGLQPITPLPEAPDYHKGIINLRGLVIPVVDMRLKFGMEQGVYSDRTCIIIVSIADSSVGLIVDSVSEVLTVDDGDIVPPPDYGKGTGNRYIKAIGKVGSEVKLLLNCNTLFHVDEFDNLKDGVAS